MRVHAIFFDFGGTLVDSDASIEQPWEVWINVGHQFGVSLTADRVRPLAEEADRRFGPRIYEFAGRTSEYWEMHDLWLIDQLDCTVPPRGFLEAIQAAFNDPKHLWLFPDALSALERARSIAPHLGVISNHTDRLLGELDHLGIRPLLDSVTYSQEVGAEKPDSRVFEHALGRSGSQPHESVHIGNSWEADYLGATRAGIHAIWLNREGTPAPRPCRQIRSLAELDRMLPG
jgi:putative hydrolase of the HAD superfamily